MVAGEGALEVDTDTPAPAGSYLDPDCAPGPRGGVQEDLQVSPEDRRGDHTGAVPTGEGAPAAGDKRTERGGLVGTDIPCTPVSGRHVQKPGLDTGPKQPGHRDQATCRVAGGGRDLAEGSPG